MGKKLLIVDDRREVRALVRATLGADDWEVVEAETGEEGVTAAAKHRPGLVIMDMVMPGGIDGLEATKIIKSAPETAGCKVIMLTGANRVARDAALKAGVDEFIQKPFSPLDLIEKTGALFGDRTEK